MSNYNATPHAWLSGCSDYLTVLRSAWEASNELFNKGQSNMKVFIELTLVSGGSHKFAPDELQDLSSSDAGVTKFEAQGKTWLVKETIADIIAYLDLLPAEPKTCSECGHELDDNE